MLERCVDYNQISQVYDEVRQADVDLLNRFLQEVKFGPKSGAEFLELVRKKGYSMLHLVGADEYERGLQMLETALQKGKLKVQSAGTTLVWVTKQ